MAEATGSYVSGGWRHMGVDTYGLLAEVGQGLPFNKHAAPLGVPDNATLVSTRSGVLTKRYSLNVHGCERVARIAKARRAREAQTVSKDYSKHKERDPQDTVAAILGILERLGVDTELRRHPCPYEGMHSNYVTIPGTMLSVSGKGTTEDYACASGFAELMERIQNGVLVLYPPDGPEAYADNGYLAAPDERYARATDIVARQSPVLKAWLERLGITTEEECLALLELLPKLRYDRGDGAVAEVPFADPMGGEVVWLPAALVVYACGSNGMAAGNTAEEALVQGLSEVFERYVARRVLQGEDVPPRIPPEMLADYGVSDLIARVERGGRYEVRVHDASLGRGYPVVMTTLVDRQRATFGVRFGSHPSLPIAVERTLTETFQNRNAQVGTDMNRLASLEKTACLDNLTSMFVSGLGSLPYTALSGEPGWDAAHWPSWEGASNAEMLGYMLALLLRDGFRPLVRDVSHLGFPSYQIVVPGMSDVFAPSAGLYESLVGNWQAKRALESFPRLSAEEQGYFLGLEPSDLVHTSPGMFGPPITDGRMHPCRVFGFLHLARGEYEAARRCFEVFSTLTGEMGMRHWRAMTRYASCREEGLGHEEAMSIVGFLNPPDIVWHVGHEATNARESFSRLFPQLRCPDCMRCELLARGGCAGLVGTNEVFEKIARAMRNTTLTQEPLLGVLQDILASERLPHD